MKTPKNIHILAILAGSVLSSHAADEQYINEIWQVQLEADFAHIQPVNQKGQHLSPLAIDPGGAVFQLWTKNTASFATFLLDHKYVGAYVPQGTVRIFTEDPYITIPRTRADRPFDVIIDVGGFATGDSTAPAAALYVKIEHHVQSYGDGDGLDINRDDATLINYGYIGAEGEYKLTYNTNIPGVDRSKVSGEERFTVMSLPDYMAPPAQIASKYVQIWPVADAKITGLSSGDALRFNTPAITIELNDLYPDSETYAHLYKGNPSLGTVGTVIPGSAVIVNDAVPQDRTLVIEDWDQVIDKSGVWTMEVLTETPFGTDRLAYVTFSINRDIQVNGGVTTVE